MKKILKGAVSILLMAALSIPMFSMAAMGAEATEVPVVQFPVTLELTGYKPFTPEELNVVLTAEDKRNPMPEGSTDGVYNLKVAAAGQYTLGPIAFPNLGIYQYTIRQTAGTNAKGQYDSNLYRMIIYVTNAQTGGRETTVVVYQESGYCEIRKHRIYQQLYRRWRKQRWRRWRKQQRRRFHINCGHADYR